MRIDRFDLLAFGRFTDTSLDLSAGEQGLHLIYGNNEAGKSTSLRALVAWLFGIPVRSQDNFLHTHAQLRLGGRLRRADGKTLEFVRRKGNKGTLLDPATGEVMDDALLEPFVPRGIDESLFRHLYGIDHERLVAGGQELLDQSGDVGQALFSAAAGTAGLRNVVSELRAGAENLFKPRASTKVINQAVASYKEAQKRIRETTLPVSEWKRLQKELADTLEQIKEIEEIIRRASGEKSRLERLVRVKGPLAERRVVRARLAELQAVPLLPADFEANCRMFTKDFQDAEKAQKKGQARLALLDEEAASLNVRQDFLDNEGVITELFKELGAVEKTMKDRPRQDGQRRRLRNDAMLILKSIRPNATLEDADQLLRPLLNNQKWVITLAQSYELLAQKQKTAETLLRDIEDEHAAVKKELFQIPPSGRDLREIKATIAAARKAGDVEARLADSAQRAKDAMQTVQAGFAALGRFAGTHDELEKIPMPVSETLDAYEKRFDEISDACKDLNTRLKDVLEQKKNAEQELKVLLLQEHVPTLMDLEDSRSLRERGWALIRGRYIEQRDVGEAVTSYAPAGDLPGVYEDAVSQADRVADAMRASSERVAKRANLEARIEEFGVRIQKLEEEELAVQRTHDALNRAWEDVWKPLGIEPGTPREMKQWLLRAAKLITDMKSARLVATEAARLEAEETRHREAVARQIAVFDAQLSTRDMGLAAMIEWCEQRVEHAEDRLKQRARLQQSLEMIGQRMTRAKEALEAVKKERRQWAAEWSQAIDGLGVAPDVHPELAKSILERLADFFRTFDESEALGRRIFGMDQVEKEFETRVLQLADRAGWEMHEQDPRSFVTQLNRDVVEARDARATLKKISGQKKDIKEEIESALITMATARENLARLRELAEVQSDEDLEAAGERSRDKRELMQRLDSLEKELIRNGDGLPIETLEKEFDQAEMDAITEDLDKVRLTLEEYQKKRDELRDVRQTLQNEIQAKDGSALAAGASQDAQEHLAVIASGMEEYLRLRIAGQILEQRIETYRRENQGPLLGRAGELFTRLTLGSYDGLRDELDSAGNPVLLGIRPGDAEVPVEGMSEGTRDQLYLALRLATLERHLGTGEPMPFVVDDILIGFDDQRTRVCLQVLAELAARTQVLVFTHHKRVVELAREIEARAGLFVHQL
ncbi:AAA family ATPase [Desulfoplanes sp. PS50]